jgi:hypothetical protein
MLSDKEFLNAHLENAATQKRHACSRARVLLTCITMKKLIMTLSVLILSMATVSLAADPNTNESPNPKEGGTAKGAAVGAVGGAVVGHPAAGAAVGGAVGHHKRHKAKKKAEKQQEEQANQSAQTNH